MIVLFTVSAILQTQYQYILSSLNLSQRDVEPFLPLLLFAGNCLVSLILPLWAILRLVFRRRRWISGLLLLVISCLPLTINFTPILPRERAILQEYNGFQAWVRSVDPVPIQSWLATQPASDEIVSVPPADWPSAIRRLWPERVDLWRGQGVALSWGFISRDDSDRRQVFIGRMADSPPPTERHIRRPQRRQPSACTAHQKPAHA